MLGITRLSAIWIFDRGAEKAVFNIQCRATERKNSKCAKRVIPI